MKLGFIVVIPAVISLVNCLSAIENKDYRLAFAWGIGCMGWVCSWVAIVSNIK